MTPSFLDDADGWRAAGIVFFGQGPCPRRRGSTSTEKQAYQQHFLDLCQLVGHPTPARLDPENKFFTFEAGAVKQDGGQGWAG